MNLRIIPVTVFIACGLHAALGQGAEVQPLQIGQVLRYALENAPTLTSANATVSSAEAQKLASIAAFLPSLSLSDQPQIFHPFDGAGSTVVGGVVVPAQRPFDANAASVNLNLNLYDGGKDTANHSAAIAALRSARTGLTATLDATFQQLLTDFAAVGVDQLTVDGQEQAVRINQELVDLTQQRFQGQFASRIDLIKAQQQALQAQAQISLAHQQLTTDFEKLYADMGMAQTASGSSLQTWLPIAPAAQAAGVAIEDDPSVQSAQATVLADQHKVDAARAEYYPTVALTGQYNLLGLSSSSMRQAFGATGRNNYVVGVLLTVPLLPFYNAKADVETAQANVDSAQGQYQGALASAANRVADVTTRLEEARKTLDVASRSAMLAHQNVSLVKDSYAAQQSDLLDVNDARLLAEQADLSLKAAQLNFRLSGWEMFRTVHPRQFPTALLSAVLDGPAQDDAPAPKPGESRQ